MVEAYGALFAYHFLRVSGPGIFEQATIFILRDAAKLTAKPAMIADDLAKAEPAIAAAAKKYA